MTQSSTDRLEGAQESAEFSPANISMYPVPLHVTGHLAPVPDEIDAVDLPVEGALPPELVGRLLRNGPNPLPGRAVEALVRRPRHGARHPPRRWPGDVVPQPLGADEGAGRGRRAMTFRPDGQRDRTVVEANTSVIAHAGRILALIESGFPHVLTPGAGDPGRQRLRRPADHRDDRAPQDRSGDRRTALLRLRRDSRRT